MSDADNESQREFSIDELARAADATVRNVRAYQDRGLLPPPEKRGRKGIYGESHLARLRLITQLLDRGYTMANIGELLEVWEKGQDVSALLGLERAVTSPFSDEIADYVTVTEGLKKYGLKITPRALAKALNLGIIERKGTRFKVPSPRLLYAGGELTQAGIPLEEMLDTLEDLRGNVERVADQMVGLVAKYVFDEKFGNSGVPAPEAVPELAEIIWRLRPLVEKAVMPEVSRAMNLALKHILGDRLTLLMEHLNAEQQSED